METVRATMWPGAVINAGDAYTFAVRVDGPIPMSIRVYRVSFVELLSRVTAFAPENRIIFDLLSEKVLADYNEQVEDSPILDMLSDPDKYKRCSSVDFTREY